MVVSSSLSRVHPGRGKQKARQRHLLVQGVPPPGIQFSVPPPQSRIAKAIALVGPAQGLVVRAACYPVGRAFSCREYPRSAPGVSSGNPAAPMKNAPGGRDPHPPRGLGFSGLGSVPRWEFRGENEGPRRGPGPRLGPSEGEIRRVPEEEAPRLLDPDRSVPARLQRAEGLGLAGPDVHLGIGGISVDDGFLLGAGQGQRAASISPATASPAI